VDEGMVRHSLGYFSRGQCSVVHRTVVRSSGCAFGRLVTPCDTRPDIVYTRSLLGSQESRRYANFNIMIISRALAEKYALSSYAE
jgi:hypothetical protein